MIDDVANLFRALDPPLWLVTASHGGRRSGLIATCVASASIVADAPRVVVGLARQHFTWSLVDASGSFGLHLLSLSEVDWIERFGINTGRDVDKFAGLSPRVRPDSPPLLTEAPAALLCRVEDRLETGDRTLFLAEVVDALIPNPTAIEAPLNMRIAAQTLSRQTLERLRDSRSLHSAWDSEAIRRWRSERSSRITSRGD